ncbi:hypothetical protein O7608_01340 [Solwaraspora sp. WMMA2056]|uniref:hypothetical protein n=1 Tax=Solwaraspora sp. WMMA2056 TaxID=3015161 RepID=UPI00259B9498|nr:hypothetical protein [Solwaraspora sp. WMMA2056]WJK41134.1 hypothetical protein O7608_01340 [Solwaraspora sp. WMMA2056]
MRRLSVWIGLAVLAGSMLPLPMPMTVGTAAAGPMVAAAAPKWLPALAARQQTLSITVPATRSYGAGFRGSTIGGQLGTVTVRDFRSISPNVWVATVSSSLYTTGGATPPETIGNGQVSYWSGPATSTSGGGTRVPGQPTSAAAVVLSVPRTAFSKTSGNANNTVAWNPTVSIAVPTGAIAGAYTGTITHSVA